MNKICQKCAKQYFCKGSCKFKSWKNTKNYGEVRRIEECSNDIKDK